MNRGYSVGIFALFAGLAFGDSLRTFVDLSREAVTTPPLAPINVNQLLLRLFLLRVGTVALFVLPLVTAPAYTRPGVAERSARRTTLETFLAAMRVYLMMLAVSLALVTVLFVFGTPAIGPIVSGYLGLLLIGSAFIASALFISSLARSALAAGLATYALSLALGATTWLANAAYPSAQAVFQTFSVGERLDDFAKGVIDTAPAVTCIAITMAALFLTMRGLAGERAIH